MCRTDQLGFTLWELLMTLLVAGILLGIGVPNVMEFQRNSAMSGVANDFVTGVLMARSEAVKRQVPVTLCLSDDPTLATPVCSPGPVADSTRGFVVWVDENGNFNPDGSPDLDDTSDGNAIIDAGEPVLLRTVAPSGTIRTSTNCGYIAYRPNGWARQVGALCFQPADWHAVLFCDDRGRRVAAGTLSSARAIRIEVTGRATVLQETANVDPAIGLTGATCL